MFDEALDEINHDWRDHLDRVRLVRMRIPSNVRSIERSDGTMEVDVTVPAAELKRADPEALADLHERLTEHMRPGVTITYHLT